MSIQLDSSGSQGPVYIRLLRNRSFMLLWSGNTISGIGDTFFSIAVMWAIYSTSHSMLQTSFIQVVGQLDRILFGTIAGIFADRWDRKKIMISVNILSALILGALAAWMGMSGHLSTAAIYAAIFLLNVLSTFFQPASAAMMPEVVGRDLLASAQGLFSAAGNTVSLISNSLAGFVVAAVGALWGVAGDAISFLFPALFIAMAKLPAHTKEPTSAESSPSFIREIIVGWRAISNQPVVKAMVWISMLVNVASFLGPMTIGLIHARLHSGPAALGMWGSAGVIGAAIGGILAGPLERRIGAGRILAVGWVLTGLCIIGQAISIWLPVTLVLEVIGAMGLTVGGVSIGAVTDVLIPENLRGRVWGISGSLSVIAIPISSLISGWLADIFSPVALYAVGGIWVVGVAALCWFNRHIRTARI